jgi:hypothetical protein
MRLPIIMLMPALLAAAAAAQAGPEAGTTASGGVAAVSAATADERVGSAGKESGATHPTAPVLDIPLPANPATQPIPQGLSAEQAAALSADEKNILSAVRDRDGQVDSLGLYVLLRHAAMLPGDDSPLQAADQPNVMNFWSEPERYRGRLIKLHALYAEGAREWTDQVTPTSWWGSRRVWMVYMFVAGTPEPMAVFLTEPPPKDILRGQGYEIAGFFYKLLRQPTSNKDAIDKDQPGFYPVLVAKKLYRSQVQIDNPGSSLVGLFLAGLGVLAIVWFMLKRRTGRRKGAEDLRQRLRLRIQRQLDLRATAGDEAGPVDPELSKQIEEYQAQRQGQRNRAIERSDGDNTNHSS